MTIVLDRLPLLALVVVACGSRTPAPPAPTLSPRLAPVDAAAVAVDAAPVAVIDETVPPLVFRHFSTGVIKMNHSLDTWTLRYRDGHATMVVERKLAGRKGPVEIGVWQPAGSTVYTGVATEADGVVLELTAGPETLKLACKRGRVAVAAADAVRKPHAKRPAGEEECGDTGRFVPATTTQVDVLRCKTADLPMELAFAAAPGIEYLSVNDDCSQQGGGLRQIGPDGAIASPR